MPAEATTFRGLRSRFARDSLRFASIPCCASETGTAAAPQTDVGLFAEAPQPEPPFSTEEKAVVRQRWVTTKVEQIRTARTLELNLFPDVRYSGVLDRIEQTSTGYV
jgi:hypothetical protein